MMKRIENQSGFTLVEALLIILILLVIGGVGYMVYQNDHKTNNTNKTASKTTTSSTSSKSTTATNPYAGWQQLCSSSGGLCMKYPSSWKLSGSDTDGYTITSTSGTTAVDYVPSGVKDGGLFLQGNAGNCPSSILSLTPLTATSNNLDVVKSIISCTANVNSSTTFSNPTYFVVSASEANSQGLKAGTTDNTSVDIRINSTTSSSPELLDINDLSNSTYTTYTTSSAAQAWFSSSDVQTAGKILSSVSYAN